MKITFLESGASLPHPRSISSNCRTGKDLFLRSTTDYKNDKTISKSVGVQTIEFSNNFSPFDVCIC